MNIHEILQRLPHRYPFLLVDRVLEVRPGERLVALKNVTINEPFFVGHFPHHPIMPGVLIIEALAQAAGLLSFSRDGEEAEKSVIYFVGIDQARFKKPVTAGDQLILEVDQLRAMRGIAKFKAIAKVDDVVVAEAELMCTKRPL